jgi:hypothetical protein
MRRAGMIEEARHDVDAVRVDPEPDEMARPMPRTAPGIEHRTADVCGPRVDELTVGRMHRRHRSEERDVLLGTCGIGGGRGRHASRLAAQHSRDGRVSDASPCGRSSERPSSAARHEPQREDFWRIGGRLGRSTPVASHRALCSARSAPADSGRPSRTRRFVSAVDQKGGGSSAPGGDPGAPPIETPSDVRTNLTVDGGRSR